MADYLLHSMAEFKPIFEQALQYKKPKKIVEIGTEYAGSSKVLLDYAVQNNAHVYLIDPYPYVNLEQELKKYQGYFTHIAQLSLEALKDLVEIDFFFIDGDHNYYTVSNELALIYSKNPSVWTFLHDVAWPCDFRDMYYNPATLSTTDIHEYTYQDGVDKNNHIVKNGGFHGAGKFAWAKKYGGERNGVKKAIEDFLKDNAQYSYNQMNAVMGLGLITPKDEKALSDILFTPYQNQLIESMEKNRIELYIKVLELQHHLDIKNREQNNNRLFRIARKLSKIMNYKPF